jgi:hypothetical protein
MSKCGSTVSMSGGTGPRYGWHSQSLSSPLSVLDAAYHNGSDCLKLFAPGARAMQYGCAILQAGAMELLNNCRSYARSARLRPTLHHSHNFHVFGQSKKKESSGPKTNVISGIVSSSVQCCLEERLCGQREADRGLAGCLWREKAVNCRTTPIVARSMSQTRQHAQTLVFLIK